MRRLGVDVDGILANFNDAYVARIRQVTGRNLFADPPLMDVWNYPQAAGYTGRELRLVWDDIKADGRFWSSIKPYDDISTSMSGLRWQHARGGDIYFITARPGDSAKRQTEQWLLARQEFLCPIPPTVLMSSDKAACCKALELDAYVDDRWENARDVGQTPTRSYLLTRPWNVAYAAHAHNVTRVNSLSEFFALLP